MTKFFAIATVATALSFSVVSAEASGWGSRSTNNTQTTSSGLLNVSPTVRLGNIGVLNGIGILNNSPILSGNNTGLGILGTGTGLLNSNVGNKSTTGGKRR